MENIERLSYFGINMNRISMHQIDNLYYQKYYLKEGLEKYIKYVWIMKSDGPGSKPDLLIPDGYPEIIFVQQGGYSKEFIDPDKPSFIINQSCIIGIQTQSVLARRLDNCQLIGLKLMPAGAYALFSNRLKITFNTNISLEKFEDNWLLQLDKKLRTLEENATIIRFIKESLHNQIQKLENNQDCELAASFLHSILSVKGQITIQDLAKKHCISIRHFQRKFKGFFGISPKKFLNIIRFKHLYKSSILQQLPPTKFLDYGYYDQMHFIKDFQKNLGVSPSNSIEETFLHMNKMAKINS